MAPTNERLVNNGDSGNGQRYPLRPDGRSLIIVAVVVVWMISYLAYVFAPGHPPVAAEVDLVFRIVLGGVLGWSIVNALAGGRGKGG